jgi:hypothetical protein
VYLSAAAKAAAKAAALATPSSTVQHQRAQQRQLGQAAALKSALAQGQGQGQGGEQDPDVDPLRGDEVTRLRKPAHKWHAPTKMSARRKGWLMVQRKRDEERRQAIEERLAR